MKIIAVVGESEHVMCRMCSVFLSLSTKYNFLFDRIFNIICNLKYLFFLFIIFLFCFTRFIAEFFQINSESIWLFSLNSSNNLYRDRISNNVDTSRSSWASRYARRRHRSRRSSVHWWGQLWPVQQTWSQHLPDMARQEREIHQRSFLRLP